MSSNKDTKNRLDRSKKLLAVVLFLFLSATVSFHFLEDLSWHDSVYFTIATLTTVGYGDITPTQPLTKMLTSIFIVSGVGAFLLFLGSVGESLLREKLEEVLGMERVEDMENHVILCGYGRVGRTIADELKEMKKRFVIIEEDEEKVKGIIEDSDYSVIHGDAKKEEMLEKARIKVAKALITTLGDDADNVFVIITAKALNPALRVISTATKDENRKKLRKIGAEEVITPEIVVGKVIARSLAVPSYLSLFDRLELTKLQEVCKLELKPEYAGKKVEDLGVDVLAIVRGEEIIKKPGSKAVLKEGDKIVAVTEKKQHGI